METPSAFKIRNWIEGEILKGRSQERIERELEKKGWQDVLDRYEIGEIVTRVRAAKAMIPRRPGRIWPRIIGLCAILMGLGAIYISRDANFGRRYNPGGYGVWAVILGVILVVKPSASSSEM